jgi:prepilin-type processing-associated H-X9-DG protein
VQLGVALQNYETAHEVLPPGAVNQAGPIAEKPQGYHLSWVVQILPYIEQKNAYNRINFAHGVYDVQNGTVRAHGIGTLSCPSDGGPSGRSSGVASNNYVGCHHDVEAPIDVTNHGVLFLNSSVRYEDISDGTSFTIFVGEAVRGSSTLGWMSGTRATLRNTGWRINSKLLPPGMLSEDEEDDLAPGDDGKPDAEAASLAVGGFSSRHPGGANFAFGDGSVRFLKNTITARVLHALGNRADGEMVSDDQF